VAVRVTRGYGTTAPTGGKRGTAQKVKADVAANRSHGAMVVGRQGASPCERLICAFNAACEIQAGFEVDTAQLDAEMAVQ
jgi:hypothetical protein